LVDAPFRIEPVLLDIEELNRRAHEGTFDLTKLSVGAFAAVGDRYRLSRRGAALGHGVRPLAVAREAVSLANAVRGCVAISGREATACRLLRLAAPESHEPRENGVGGLAFTDDAADGVKHHEAPSAGQSIQCAVGAEREAAVGARG